MSGNLFRRLVRRLDGDEGVALVTAMLFITVATAIATSVFFVTINNQQNANRDRQSLGALATAEGGIAQAVQVIRTNPPGYFTCQEPANGSSPSGACTTNPVGWTNASNPEKVSANGTIGTCVAGQACYSVWISTLTPYNPLPYTNSAGTPSHTVVYRVHSTGLSGGGPAARSVAIDVKAKLATFPIGLYGDYISTNGSPGVHHESIFSLNCITNRSADGQSGNGLSFDAQSSTDPYANYDWAYDLPEAAHSAAVVSTSSNCTASASNGNAIHATSVCANNAAPGGNYNYFPYDQDSMGGSLSGTPCNNMWTSPQTGRQYAVTSKFTTQDLYDVGYRPQGLTQSEYDSLRAQAQAMGTYLTGNVSSSTIGTVLNSTTASNVILYIDAQGSSITFGPGNVPSRFFRGTLPPSTTSCPLNNLIVVVRNGSLTYNASGYGGSSTNYMVASMFVPDGAYSGQGSAQILGTLYAKNLSLSGTQDFFMDSCFINNPPSLLLNLKVSNYREIDTQNIQ